MQISSSTSSTTTNSESDSLPINKIINGNAAKKLQDLPSASVDMCMTSPPYFAQRDYGVDGQVGLERMYQDYVTTLYEIFQEVKRVLKKQGSCWIVMGDTYAGPKEGNTNGRIDLGSTINCAKKGSEEVMKGIVKHRQQIPDKSLMLIPDRLAIKMLDNGWILRNKIIWHKPACIPSSARDRFTIDYETLYFFTKSQKYFFETQYEPKVTKPDDSRIKRSVWSIGPQPYNGAHFAAYPEALCETPIKAGCPIDGVVLDPFFGSGTTGVVALKNARNFIGIELSKEYCELAKKRLQPYLQQTKLKI